MGYFPSAAGGLLLLGLGAGCSQEEYSINPLTLTEAALEVTTALGEDPVFPLESPPEIRTATRAELADALYVEILPAVNRLGLEGSRGESLAREQAQGLSRLVGVKYFSGRNAVLVVPANVSGSAAGLSKGADQTRALLRGLLLLECAHAVGVQRYRADQISDETQDLDRSMTRRAVVEGFARFLARRTARRTQPTWEANLDLCTEMIVGQPPEAIRNAQDAAEDQAFRQLAFIHLQGEEFVTVVFDTGGEPAIQKLFENPPDDPDLVGQPNWYLEPASRPIPTRDLGRALTLFEERFDAEQFGRRRIQENRQRIETQLAFASEPNLNRILAGVVDAQTSVITSNSDPEKNNVSLQIKEHSSAAEAGFFVGQVRQIIEADRTGNVREIAGPDGEWRGILFSDPPRDTGGMQILGGVVEAGVLSISVSLTGDLALEPALMELLPAVVAGAVNLK